MLKSIKLTALVLIALSALFLAHTSGVASHKTQPIALNTRPTPREAGLDAPPQKKLDPAAWGTTHPGKPVPEFVHGDECLFCHRNDIGPGWQKNTHGITIRQGEDATEWRDIFKGQQSLSAIAPQVEYYMGSRHRLRFLKKEGYGKFAVLNTP